MGGVAGVDPLGGEGQQEVLAEAAATAFEDRAHDVVGGAGVGRGLKHHQRARGHLCGDRRGSLLDHGEVGAVLVDGRGDADQDHAGVGAPGGISGEAQAAGGDSGAQVGGADAGHDRATLGQRPHPVGVGVDAHHLVSRDGGCQGHGQPDVALAEHGHLGPGHGGRGAVGRGVHPRNGNRPPCPRGCPQPASMGPRHQGRRA